MKKVLSILLVLLGVTSTAWAETKTAERRNAFEFIVLYTSRLEEIGNMYSLDITDVLPIYEGLDYMNEIAGENKYYVAVPAGELVVSVPDFNIVRFEGTLLSFMHTDDKEGEKDIARSITAYSALEYGGYEAYWNDQFADKAPSMVDRISKQAADEFLDAFDKIFLNKTVAGKLMAQSGNKFFLLSGEHYDYYVQYFCEEVDGRTAEFISLIAEAK